jgi:hypothetical protein
MNPSIFVSYRRSDNAETGNLVGMIVDRLERRLGDNEVFFDKNRIQAGDCFPEELKQGVESADLVLVVIGPTWADELARRRTEKVDFVENEIVQALNSVSTHIIILLIGGATMPDEEHIAANSRQMLKLLERNAVVVPSSLSARSLERVVFGEIADGLEKAIAKHKRAGWRFIASRLGSTARSLPIVAAAVLVAILVAAGVIAGSGSLFGSPGGGATDQASGDSPPAAAAGDTGTPDSASAADENAVRHDADGRSAGAQHDSPATTAQDAHRSEPPQRAAPSPASSAGESGEPPAGETADIDAADQPVGPADAGSGSDPLPAPDPEPGQPAPDAAGPALPDGVDPVEWLKSAAERRVPAGTTPMRAFIDLYKSVDGEIEQVDEADATLRAADWSDGEPADNPFAGGDATMLRVGPIADADVLVLGYDHSGKRLYVLTEGVVSVGAGASLRVPDRSQGWANVVSLDGEPTRDTWLVIAARAGTPAADAVRKLHASAGETPEGATGWTGAAAGKIVNAMLDVTRSTKAAEAARESRLVVERPYRERALIIGRRRDAGAGGPGPGEPKQVEVGTRLRDGTDVLVFARTVRGVVTASNGPDAD